MDGLMNIANAYAELVNLLAVVSTALATIVIAWLTGTLANENRRLRKAGTEPKVVAYLMPDARHQIMINFVLANIGQGPARDVRFSLDYDPADFQSHNVALVSSADRKAISVLPQGEKLVAFFGAGYELFQEPRLKPFRVKVSYRNAENVRYIGRYLLDISQFAGLVTIGTPAEHEIAESVKKIAKAVESWTGGIGRLKVETISTKERQEDQKRMIEMQRAKRQQAAIEDEASEKKI